VVRYQPSFDSLEDRLVLSAQSILTPALAPALVQAAAPAQAAAQQASAIIPISVVDVVVDQAGQLVANVLVGNVAQVLQITNITLTNPGNGECPILHLELGEIHLDLLGLNVDTSRICLDVTAQPGGGLLGDLLCDVGGLLDTGTFSLANLQSALSADQLSGLLNQVVAPVLDASLARLLSTSSVNSAAVSGTGTSGHAACDILNLDLGPIDLNVLGLHVALDNCADGPVTVDITAQPGSGKLLGNLLCNLSHLLDNDQALSHVLDVKLNKIARTIGKLF